MKRRRLIAVYGALLGALLLPGTGAAQDDPTPDLPLVSAHKYASESGGNSVLVSIVVNDNGDATDVNPGNAVCETAAGNGVCTLRAAVTEANALAGNDTITFAPSVTSISVNGQIPISSNMAVIGDGPSLLTVRNVAALSTTSRVFNITNFAVQISGMTISDGNVTGNGGGINNIGTLTITNCVFTNNRANGAGGIGGAIRSTNTLVLVNSVVSGNASVASTSGGISFAGTNLTITNTTVSGNTAFGNGGGMNLSATTALSISNTTVSGNTAGAASGGVFLNRGTIINSTISGNSANGAAATDGGGGIRIQAGTATVTLASSTVTANTAPNTTAGARSGIWHETGTLTITSSLVAANVTQDIQRDGTGVITNGGFNLIGENTSVTTEFPNGAPNGTNYVGTDAAPLDPMIGPLASNGGPTQTHALQAGSIAIDKGNAPGLPYDQRTYIRPVDQPGIPNNVGGDGSDIGAYEFMSAAGLTVSISGRVTDAAGNLLSRARVILLDTRGSYRTALTSSFGYYRFDGVPAGDSYTVSVERKGYRFSSVVVSPFDNVVNLDFVAEP